MKTIEEKPLTYLREKKVYLQLVCLIFSVHRHNKKVQDYYAHEKIS